jgi:exopolysaccharide production protein ExoY
MVSLAWQDTAVDAAHYRPVERLTKAVMDLVLALLVLFAALPILLASIALIVLVDRQNPFYLDERVGQSGRPFGCLKLRTMRNDPGILEQYLAGHPAEAAAYTRTRKLLNDPRISPLGGVLRKFSIDEVPQLLNVLARQMSIVGPRPITVRELLERDTDGQLLLRVRPGLTGLWQVSGRSDLGPADRERLDASYVRNWSLLLDLKLLAMTPSVVLTGRGAR